MPSAAIFATQSLGRSQRLDATQERPPGPRSRGCKLLAHVLSEQRGAAAVREIERASQWAPGGGALVGTAQRGTELGEGTRALERRLGLLERRGRLTKQIDPALAGFDDTDRVERDPDCPNVARRPAQLELLVG